MKNTARAVPVIIGLDIAKNFFQVHAVDAAGQVVLRRKLSRGEVLRFFEAQPKALVGIEACGTGHFWAREIAALGHEVKLLPPSYVKAYVKRGKTDAADAEAILTVVRLGLPRELRRSLACTNIIENIMGSVRRVCRNVKRWRDASMALRWTAAAMLEAVKGFRRLKAKRQLPQLRAALLAHRQKADPASSVAQAQQAA